MNARVRDTLLVAGSANLDFVVRASHVPAPGETVLGRDFATFPGGKGANQAVACARAGDVRTRMLLALGNDSFAASLEDSLEGACVELQVVRSALPTGTAFICLSDDAENAITVAPGANAALRGDELSSLHEVSHLLLQLETPLEAVTAFALAARAAGVQVVLNAAPARALPTELLRSVDVLIVNEGELAALTGHNGTVNECLAQLDVPCVVVTLGARGCCARQGGEFFLQPGFKVQAVDTTAAGDTFCGALAAALCRQLPMADALRHASAASALTCTRLGAQSSIPAWEEVQALLQDPAAVHSPQAVAALAAYCGFG
ncbi:ribokinase [Pseudoxanthomonas yeongjuensis]|jgi:ribokinase|uniref:ribokinase n=1 Tax=Pseudoxanthomonas yeongjuensis TaxID=377616 RepID=UPI00139152A3|nr:ribokinase [Pseudoxanthomonas yeongjuensis]KAF1714626.1 ribokinase [Pseudoxanthomonas yeongjuensis]